MSYSHPLLAYAFGALKDWKLACTVVQQAYLNVEEEWEDRPQENNLFDWMQEFVEAECETKLRSKRTNSSPTQQSLDATVRNALFYSWNEEARRALRLKIDSLHESLVEEPAHTANLLYEYYCNGVAKHGNQHTESNEFRLRENLSNQLNRTGRDFGGNEKLFDEYFNEQLSDESVSNLLHKIERNPEVAKQLHQFLSDWTAFAIVSSEVTNNNSDFPLQQNSPQVSNDGSKYQEQNSTELFEQLKNSDYNLTDNRSIPEQKSTIPTGGNSIAPNRPQQTTRPTPFQLNAKQKFFFLAGTCVYACLAFFLWTLCLGLTGNIPIGKLSKVDGTAWIIQALADQETLGTEGQYLTKGDKLLLSNSGRAEFTYRNGLVTQALGNNAQLRIIADDSVDFFQENGVCNGSITLGKNEPPILISTKHATFSAVQATYTLITTEEVTFLSLQKGNMTATPAYSTDSKIILAGEVCEIRSSSSAPNNFVILDKTQTRTPVHVLPAQIEAEDYMSGGQGIGYFDSTASNLGNNKYRPEDGVDIYTDPNDAGITFISDFFFSEWLKYRIYVERTGNYTIGIRAAAKTQNAIILVSLDNAHAIKTFNVLQGPEYQTKTQNNFYIRKGFHEITVRSTNGGNWYFDWVSLDFQP